MNRYEPDPDEAPGVESRMVAMIEAATKAQAWADLMRREAAEEERGRARAARMRQARGTRRDKN